MSALLYPSDIAFTAKVKAIQTRKGSRRAYAHQEEAGSWRTTIDEDLKGFIQAQTSVFLGTANAEGQPYIQHRGGAPGFLRVVDEHTIAFVDYAGNRQYITSGNLLDNLKAYLSSNPSKNMSLFDNHAAVRFAYRRGYRGDIERLDRAQVNNLHANSSSRRNFSEGITPAHDVSSTLGI